MPDADVKRMAVDADLATLQARVAKVEADLAELKKQITALSRNKK